MSWVNSLAQTEKNCDFSLSGKVIDEHDHSVLEFATIYLVELGRGVVADSSGTFELDDLCNEKYTVVVSHVSCQPDTLSIQLDKNLRLTLFLEHHTEALRELTVSAQELSKNSNSAQEHKLASNNLERYSGASLGDALREIPGVSSLNTGSTIVKPVIQGLYGSRIIFVNQGVRMQDMEWGDEHAPNIDINSAKNITVVSGGSALRYGGDAVAGVVIIEPEEVLPDTITGRTIVYGATNGRGGGVTSEISKSGSKGWYGRLQGSLKRFGDFQAPRYNLTNTGVSEKGLSILAGRHLQQSGFDAFYSIFDSKVAILSASHIGSIGDLVNAINTGEPGIIEEFSYEIGLPRQEAIHQLMRLQYYRNTDFGKMQFQYNYQHNHRFEFDKRVGEDRDKPSIDLELSTHSFNGNLFFNENGNLPMEAGVVFRYQKNFANPATGIRRLIPDYHKYEMGSFISGNYLISKDLIIDAGLRYDFNKIDALKYYQKSRWEERGYDRDFADIVVRELPTQILANPIFDFHNFSYAVGITNTWQEVHKLRFNYSSSTRSPNPSELFSDGLHHGAARIELGDLRIKQETSHKLGASYGGRSGKYTWDILPHLNLIKNFLILEPVGVESTIRGAFPVYEYHQINARIWGLDLMASAQWHQKWRSNHSIKYINGQDTKGNRPIINISAPEFKNSVNFKNQSWHNFEVNLEGIFTFEQTRYPNNNFLVFIPETDSFEEVDISTPPGSYLLLNLRAGLDFTVFGNRNLNLGVAVNNLFNTKYRNYMNRLRYFADELGTNFQVSLSFNY